MLIYKDEVLNEPGNVDFGSADISGIGDGTVTGAITHVNSKLKTIGYIQFSIAGLNISAPDSGWYYVDIPIKDKLPNGAVPFGLCFGGGFDASVIADIAKFGEVIVFKSAKQFVVQSNREIRVYYYI